VRSLNPIPLAPISPTWTLSLGESTLFPFENASRGNTLPAAITDAVLMKFLLVDFMIICSLIQLNENKVKKRKIFLNPQQWKVPTKKGFYDFLTLIADG
jgi:hypothetical protein